ncbi:MAG: type II toxin-antitoxin system RelE/ParE family toxin [Bryobacterales bacterium]|nr:type II toxin-antitoxin system RelE/ParE family toxin [Bryobacterales bacterium]
MAKRGAFTDQAKADIRTIPQRVAIQVLRTLARFLEADEGDLKKLHGIDPPVYRLRTQDHRDFFRVLSADEIEVTRVLNRKDAYR